MESSKGTSRWSLKNQQISTQNPARSEIPGRWLWPNSQNQSTLGVTFVDGSEIRKKPPVVFETLWTMGCSPGLNWWVYRFISINYVLRHIHRGALLSSEIPKWVKGEGSDHHSFFWVRFHRQNGGLRGIFLEVFRLVTVATSFRKRPNKKKWFFVFFQMGQEWIWNHF